MLLLCIVQPAIAKKKISLVLSFCNHILMCPDVLNFQNISESHSLDTPCLFHFNYLVCFFPTDLIFYSIDRGRLYGFGANDWGQLGLGHTKSANKPSFIRGMTLPIKLYCFPYL